MNLNKETKPNQTKFNTFFDQKNILLLVLKRLQQKLIRMIFETTAALNIAILAQYEQTIAIH